MITTTRLAIDARLLELAEDLSAGCDSAFDEYEGMEQEFLALTDLLAQYA